MPLQGPILCSSGSDISIPSSGAWNNPNYVTSTNATFVASNLTDSNTDKLRCTFNAALFTKPALLSGIEINFKLLFNSNSLATCNLNAELSFGGILTQYISSNNSFQDILFGSDGNLWGNSSGINIAGSWYVDIYLNNINAPQGEITYIYDVTATIYSVELTDNIKTEFFPASRIDGLLQPKVRLTNRKKFASYQLPLSPLIKSQSEAQSFSHANISITKNLSAKEISQSHLTPEIAIARILSANSYSQSEGPAHYYFADSPIALKSTVITQSFASGSIVNPASVQQLKGAATSQSLSHSVFIPYIYLTSEVITQSFAPEAGKARTVTLKSKAICSSFGAENLASPYKKLVALTSEVVCSSVDSKSNISITKPLSSLANSQSISETDAITISRNLSSLSDEYSRSYCNKSILQKLSSQAETFSYTSTHEQIKIGLTSKVISQSESEYADYKVTRPLQSNTECISYSEGLKSLKQNISSQLTSQSICEYADTSIQKHISASNVTQSYLVPNWSINKKLTSEVYSQSENNSHYRILIGLTSRVTAQSVSEYADLTVTKVLNSEVLVTSEAVTNAVSISKKISSEAVSQTKEAASNISILRPFTSEVYTKSQATAQTTFNKHLASEAISQTKSFVQFRILVSLTSKVISQSINEYADLIATKLFASNTLESSYSNESVISVARQQSSLAYSQSESDADTTIFRRYNSTIICSSHNNASSKINRLLVGLSLEQTNSTASVCLTKLFKAYSISVDQSFASGNLQIKRVLASSTIDISSGYTDTLSKLLHLTSEVISQSINEYSDYRLQQALSSKTIEVSISRATEIYLGIDNIVTDSLRKVNMNMQVSTDYNYRDND